MSKKGPHLSWGSKDSVKRNQATRIIVWFLYMVGQFDDSGSLQKFSEDDQLSILQTITNVQASTLDAALEKLRAATKSFYCIINFCLQNFSDEAISQETIRDALNGLLQSGAIKKDQDYGGYRLSSTSKLRCDQDSLSVLPFADEYARLIIDRTAVEYLTEQVGKNGIVILEIPTD